ncbi:MAG: histidine--tRNA ligase, partial [Syntrophomonadaceae bacterium]|nr:histidine--tRNA ligase [Syntrophomonadaceae bacterium]
MEIKAPRGTYDILPGQSLKWQYIERIIHNCANNFGYQEIRTPIFEHTELFVRGVGESSDIVSKEMYTFSDRSNRSLTLRPEGTASCVRSLIDHKLYAGLLPVKMYYHGPMFRYDRPQAGRYRQFHQFGVEAFGSMSPYLDGEIIFLLIHILKSLGLSNFELHINSVGCPICRSDYHAALRDFLVPFKDNLCGDCQIRLYKNPLRVLDCKKEGCQNTILGYPRLIDYLCSSCRDHYEQVQAILKKNEVVFQHDDKLVRGLDYYTNTAFEVLVADLGAQSALGGGGRYNGLVSSCGGPDIPGIGFAIGLERLLMALDNSDVEITGIEQNLVFVLAMGEHLEDEAMRLVNELRIAGITAEKDYIGRSVKAQMKYADKIHARIVIFIGDEEAAGNYYTVKDMADSRQLKVERDMI